MRAGGGPLRLRECHFKVASSGLASPSATSGPTVEYVTSLRPRLNPDALDAETIGHTVLQNSGFACAYG